MQKKFERKVLGSRNGKLKLNRQLLNSHSFSIATQDRVDPNKLCFTHFSILAVKLKRSFLTNYNQFIYYEMAKLNIKKQKNYALLRKKYLTH